MANTFDHLPTSAAEHETIVPRPRSTDAIGAALDRVFSISRTVPFDMTEALAKLDSLG